jgi:2-dehydro-3-deoxyphosphogluconate aldolase/(4S)-4-hydroxy-2-oxoglutarate aldolase
MDKHVVRARIQHIGIIPSVRTSSADDARFAVETVVQAGISVAEIAMTVPDAVDVIADLAKDHPEAVIGAGTVLHLETARRCIEAGATFLTSPGLNLDIVRLALEQQVLVMPGVLSPTEVTAASEAGADLLKVFPCAPIGGESYIRALRAPFPGVPFVAAGGVNQHTVAGFIHAGVVAVGIGKELIPKQAVRLRQRDWIGELARRFVNLVKEARALHAEP